MMRLTISKRQAEHAKLRDGIGQYPFQKLVDRLAEYEDTGLTPDDIGAREYDIKLLQRQNKEFREEIYRLRDENAKLYKQLIDTEIDCISYKSESIKDKAKLGEIRILMDKQ